MPIDNTIGSQHIFEVFRPPSPLGNQPRLCSQSGNSCIGDTVLFSGTLYSDLGLTKKVGKVVGTSKIVTIAEKGTTGAITTASILYDTGSEINVAAYNESVRCGNAVSCGWGCAPSSSLKPIRVVAHRRSVFHTRASLVHRYKVYVFLLLASKRDDIVPYGVNRQRRRRSYPVVVWVR